MADSISIDKILKMYDERDRYISNFSLNVENKIKNNYNLQKSILKKYNTEQDILCKENGFLDLLKKSTKFIDYKVLSFLVRDQFYNLSIMETLSCFLRMHLSSGSGFKDTIQKSRILNETRDNLVILFSNLMNGDKKLLTFKYQEKEILQELIVGLKCINQLRKVIPTFVWTYGYTTCNMPYIINGKTFQPCRNPTNYTEYVKTPKYIGIITEYIDGDSLYDYLVQDLTKDKFLSMILTVLYSLKYANESYGFVHWDLHYSNVMMRKLSQDNNYIYLPSENKYLWVGNKLATIIDLGSCSFVMDGKTITNYFRFDLGIRPDLTESPMNDVVKLFSSIYSRINKNKTLLPLFMEIYQQLTGISDEQYLKDFMKVLEDNFDIYPNYSKENVIENHLLMDLDQLIQFVESLSQNLIIKQKPDQVLSCQTSKCISTTEIPEIILTRDEIFTVTEFLKAINAPVNDQFIEDFVVKFIQQTVHQLGKIKSPTANAKSLIIYDQLYYLLKDIQSVKSSSQWNLNVVEMLNKLEMDVRNKLQLFQNVSLQYWRGKNGIRPRDHQISELGKDLKSK